MRTADAYLRALWLTSNHDLELIRDIQRDALETAAKVCDEQESRWTPATHAELAARIRELKP